MTPETTTPPEVSSVSEVSNGAKRPEPPKRTEFPLDLARVAQDMQLRKVQVENVVQLLDEGNTIPFITRYRKERTGGLNEEVLRQIQARVHHLRQLAERKQTVLKSIEGQGKLTDALRAAILAADTPKRLEDLYLPYKPKKRTLATTARERGLEPLAQAVWNRDPAVANLPEVLSGMVNPEKELPTTDDVLLGVGHVLAEQIAETAEVRAAVRTVLWETGKLCTKKSDHLAEGQGLDYKDYFQFAETVRHIPPHRILAINRGEKEGSLKVHVEWNTDAVRRAAAEKLPLADHPHAEFLGKVLEDALTRLLLPSLEREIRRELTDEAEEHAVRIFARNLRSLLLQPPLRGRRVLAIDPGFRTGCKVAALDEVGNLLEDTVIYPYGKSEKGRGKGFDKGDKGKGEKVTSSPAPAGAAPATPPVEATASPAPGSGMTSQEEQAATSPVTAAAPAALEERPASGEGVASPAEHSVPSTPYPVPSTAPAESSVPPVEHAGLSPQSSVPSSPSTESLTPSVEQAVPNTPSAENAVPPAEQSVSGTLPAENVVPPADHSVPSTPPAESAAPTATPAPPPSLPEPPPPPPPSPRVEAKAKLEELSRKHQLNVIAIGNGTACRETEELVSELIAESLPDLAYVIVNEAGASVYSASAVGREEFPHYDATLRGTISIGRRLQDPLSELVKIDPQNIGVGLYQHDMHPRRLKDSLEAVIESCVNHVGVDLNTASVPLLRHVSGLNQLAARELVDYRKKNGLFKSREQLLQVPGIGPARFVQAAGFLKIIGGESPLDQTWIHPESYSVTQRLLSELNCGPDVLQDKQKTAELQEKLKGLSAEELSTRLEVGLPTLRDIFDALARPGRDPREDLPPPIFKKGILKLEDLQPRMELKGTVLNVVDFGAFVDIGLKDSGLVHISQMAPRFIRSPYDVVAVGDVVTVWVLSVDFERRRVSLTMIRPGSGRRQAEKKPPPPRPQRDGDRPPRGRKPAPHRGRQVAVPKQGQPAAGTTTETVQPAPTTGAAERPAAAKPAAPPPRPAPPPRKPQRQPPKPKLSKAALEGAAPLRTFGELKAFFEAQQQSEAPKAKPEETGNGPTHSA
jgi:uncharacterized protein